MYSDRPKEKNNSENRNSDNNREHQENTRKYSMGLLEEEEEMTHHHVIKNEDYEIVVMLEGNIETTGAACHIRTSYLPQEVLFGYRFTPTYPKFTDFEYLFDYSKFDQVEPVDLNLMRFNVAHLNPHLNYVCDTKHEFKNYQLTYQNTLKETFYAKSRYNQSVHKSPFIALSSILSAFKANNNNSNSTNESKPSFVNNQDTVDKSKNGNKHENDKYSSGESQAWVMQ